MSVAIATPADSLEGKTLASGWIIGKRITKGPSQTGANFGVCYLATRGGSTAFVKAVDFRRAFAQPDLLQAVISLAQEMAWEKEMLELCQHHGLSRIVRFVGHEYYLADESSDDPTSRVSCLIMEVGKGDLRAELNLDANRSFSWKLYVIRDVCLAVDQLHRKGVAHLDVKPSNVIAVPSEQGDGMKLGDLARSVRKGASGPFDEALWPGDPGYMPPEKWYGYRSSQWNDEREAADLYLVGSLLVFLITGVPMSRLLRNELPEIYWPEVYRGEFDSSLIDVLTLSHSQVIATYISPYLPDRFKDELIELIIQMTHPSPSRRGDKKARTSGLVGVDRFHQKFLRMARRLEIDERKQAS